MGTHAKHKMHDNSLTAWRTLDKETNEQAIYRIIKEHGPLTDRQVCERMGTQDLNDARPYITRLLKAGALAEVGKVKCERTGYAVRTTYLSERASDE